ncbi:hypothetical protein PENSPDRAFT_731810 [Peniophora sp. CONT]|nr:hypothetical protein PENSPDRAFT_731810 [Peniophora sp. CONT]
MDDVVAPVTRTPRPSSSFSRTMSCEQHTVAEPSNELLAATSGSCSAPPPRLPPPRSLTMSHGQHTIAELSDGLSTSTSGSHTTLMDLPNELLTLIVELIGPPDLSRCDPGWLVVPAICRRLLEVTEKISACWESGEIVGRDGNVQEEYGWRMREHYEKRDLPADTPDRMFSIYDKQNGRCLSFSLIYKGGYTKYFASWLNLYEDEAVEDAIQAIDRYLGGSPLLGLPRPNLTWISKICISPRRGGHVDQENFSFADVPCMVAPALQELYLSGYVVDWRCSSLRVLNMCMAPTATGEAPSDYRYPPLELYARLRDSRLTLEKVKLSGCLPSVPENDPHDGRVHADDFPSFFNFEITDNPREASWLCARIGFPVTCPPFINIECDSSLDSLRSLACEYAHSVPDPKPALPGFHGELDALTFRAGGEYESGCWVTASRITGIYTPLDPYLCLELYAELCTARYMDFDSEDNVRNLDEQVPGIEPKFVTKLEWNDLEAWNNLPPTDDLCGTQCSALHGIRHVFIEGFDARLFYSDSSAEVWTAVLRHLPNVRSLYIYAPSPASLAPLINEPDLLPALRTLWLGYGEYTKGDGDWPKDDGSGTKIKHYWQLRELKSGSRTIDAGVLRDILEKRRQSANGSAPDLEIKLVNLTPMGEIDARQVKVEGLKSSLFDEW